MFNPSGYSSSGGGGEFKKRSPGKPGARRPSNPRKLLKRRGCRITAEKKGAALDYKDVEFLGKFISDRGKIAPRSYTGACAKKQRELGRAIRKARAVGLLRVAR